MDTTSRHGHGRRAAALLLALLLPGPARAQGSAPAAIAAAERLEEEGVRLFKAGAHAEAAARYGEAYRLDPRWEYAWNRARALEEAGQLGPAAQAFGEALSRADLPAAKRAEGEQRLAALRQAQAAPPPAEPAQLTPPRSAPPAATARPPSPAAGGSTGAVYAWVAAGLGLGLGAAGYGLAWGGQQDAAQGRSAGEIDDGNGQVELGSMLGVGGLAVAGVAGAVAVILMAAGGDDATTEVAGATGEGSRLAVLPGGVEVRF